MAEFDPNPQALSEALSVIAQLRNELRQLEEDNSRALDELADAEKRIEKYEQIEKTAKECMELWAELQGGK